MPAAPRHSTLQPAASSANEFAAYAGNPDFVLSLARGLRVIESFEGHQDGCSIVEIARSTGLSRAAIRRLLHTLELLGYVDHSRQVYRLKTQALRLGFSFLSSSSVVEAARPVLECISEQLHESSSMSMLDGGQIGTSPVPRPAASSRPASPWAAGFPPTAHRWAAFFWPHCLTTSSIAYLRELKPKPYTSRTLTRVPQKAILQVRKDGYAIVDEELEAGLRSIAVPVFTRSNHVVVAINAGIHISRVDRNTLLRQCLPALQEGARSLRNVLI